MEDQNNPNMKSRLDFFLGNWRNQGNLLPGNFGPGGEISGSTFFHWGVGEVWLLYTSQLDLPGLGAYEVHGGFSYSQQSGKYQAYAVNSLGNLMVYEGLWQDENTLVFTLTNPGVEGNGRVIYSRQENGSIKMRSERRVAEGDYEVYFETTMQRSH